jgi:hypothetical protein
MSENDSTPDVTRRTALKTLGVTAGATGVGPLLDTASASGDTVTIVTKKSGDEVVETREVSRRWYTQAKRARQVSDTLSDSLLNHDDVFSVGIGIGDSHIDGLRSKKVDVRLASKTTDAYIPSEVDNVEVDIVNRGDSLKPYCYEQDYDPLRGGIVTSGPHHTGSMCCRVSKDGTQYMLSARHLFVDDNDGVCDSGSYSTVNRDAYQNGDKFGTVFEDSTERDTALIEVDPDGSRDSTSRWIVDQSGGVCARMTQNGLDYYASSGDYINMRGITTCQGQCQIQSYDNSVGCPDTNLVLTEQVFYDDYCAGPGDSGGPVYSDNSGELVVAGIITGGLSDGTVTGASASGMNQYDDIVFDTSGPYSC